MSEPMITRSIIVPQSLLEKIEAKAEREDRSFAYVCRQILIDHFEREASEGTNGIPVKPEAA